MLNSLSLGCAGFNTYLGPIRPAFLALTVLAQYHSVQVGLTARHLHVPMAVATGLVSWSLTLAPELVYLYTMQQARAKAARGAAGTDAGAGAGAGKAAVAGGGAGGAEGAGATEEYVIQMPSMGCVACINSVQGALQRLDGVLSVDVALQEKGGTARVVMEGAGPAESQRQVLLDAVGAAGFPGTVQAGGAK